MYLPNQRLAAFAALFAAVIAGCSERRAPLYSERDVQTFVTVGTPREAIVRRFGDPVDESSDGAYKILYFRLHSPKPRVREDNVFGGFEVWLRDDKAVRWEAIHRSFH